MASAEGTRTGDCAPEKDGDSSTFRTSSTFVLYAGPDDKLYLDMGEVTLEGTVSDDGYKFSGTSVDVQDLGSSGDTRREETKTSVNVVLDGAAVSGTAVTKVNVDYTCANSGCPDDETCTTTIKFVGSRIDDVALEHDPVN